MRLIAKLLFAMPMLVLVGLGGPGMRASHAQSPDYPWCIVYHGPDADGGVHCMFVSFRQCMMTAGPGSGANCVRNIRTEGRRDHRR